MADSNRLRSPSDFSASSSSAATVTSDRPPKSHTSPVVEALLFPLWFLPSSSPPIRSTSRRLADNSPLHKQQDWQQRQRTMRRRTRRSRQSLLPRQQRSDEGRLPVTLLLLLIRLWSGPLWSGPLWNSTVEAFSVSTTTTTQWQPQRSVSLLEAVAAPSAVLDSPTNTRTSCSEAATASSVASAAASSPLHMFLSAPSTVTIPSVLPSASTRPLRQLLSPRELVAAGVVDEVTTTSTALSSQRPSSAIDGIVGSDVNPPPPFGRMGRRPRHRGTLGFVVDEPESSARSSASAATSTSLTAAATTDATTTMPDATDPLVASWQTEASWSSPQPSTTTTTGEPPSSLWFLPWIPASREEIGRLTVVQLKLALADRGLRKSGNKAELQERLLAWSRQQQLKRTSASFKSSTAPLVSASKSPLWGIYQALGVALPDVISTRQVPSVHDALKRRRRQQEQQQRTGENQRSAGKEADDTVRLTVDSLAEWTRTVDLEPLLKRRQAIHQEKQQGKSKSRRTSQNSTEVSSALSTLATSSVASKEEYLSVLQKLFDKSAKSRYSNYEVRQMYAAAKEADQKGDRKLSRRILEELEQATPHDARIYRRLARLSKEDGNTEEARQILHRGLRQQPYNAHLWLGLGQLAATTSTATTTMNPHLKDPRFYYRKAIECDPHLPMPYHALGTLEHTQGHIARAMKVLKQGLEYCPKNHRLHHALGDLYREAKLLDRAETSYRRALELGPDVSSGFAYTALAYVAYERGQLDRCRYWLLRSVAQNQGRHANGWVALARMEEAEGDTDAARRTCSAAVGQYERVLLQRASSSHSWKKKKNTDTSKSRHDNDGSVRGATNDTSVGSAEQLRDLLMRRVPTVRSGDRFFNVYRNWARLEEQHGTLESVEQVYRRAIVAFPRNWKLSLDWAHYCAAQNLPHRAQDLFALSCLQASGRHADPFRWHAQYEMSRGKYDTARAILVEGASSLADVAVSPTWDSSNSDDGLEDGIANGAQATRQGRQRSNLGLADLYYTWAMCEWHLAENLALAERLFQQALQFVTTDEVESRQVRSLSLYALARLEYDRGELELAQHYIGLCLQAPQSMIDGMRWKVWHLWAHVAQALKDERLRRYCMSQVEMWRREENEGDPHDKDSKQGVPMEPQMLRREPWHWKIFESLPSRVETLSQLQFPPMVQNKVESQEESQHYEQTTRKN